tara:strand:+ start:7228 stop:8739 length:1512 start_codon:yes stop_codon:yes gene_type:complete
MNSKKIVTVNQLNKILSKIKKKVALVHGVFDILHVGHKRYFEDAKSYADLLVVSVTADKYVNKGPTRPIFNINYRTEMIASLDVVDYVIKNDSETAVNLIRELKPDFYIKGQDYKDLKKDLTKNIYKEKKAVIKNNGKIIFTDAISFSSSSIINNFYKPETITNELRNFNLDLKKLIKDCTDSIKKISNLKIAIIGEIIIDEYVFTNEMDKPSKENIHVVGYNNKESYHGGTIAVAKNLAEFCKKIDVFGAGNFDTTEKKFIHNVKNKYKNIDIFIDQNKYQSIKKSRILDENNKKIFEIYYKDGQKKNNLGKNFLKNFSHKLKNYDLVIMCDFGHGFFDKRLYELILKKSKYLTINVQTNSDNRGFNLITKYRKADLVCIDEPEIRLALSDNTSNLDVLAKNLFRKISIKTLIITRGNTGILIYKRNLKSISLSAFELNPVDTIGAGDAVLGITSLLLRKNIDIRIVAFLGNLFGALVTRYLGHSSNVNKVDVLKAINYTLK